MSNLAKVALAAAAVVAVLFGASRLLPSASGPGATQPSPTPIPTVTPSPAVTPGESAAPSVAIISPGPICDGSERYGQAEPGTYSAGQSDDNPVPYSIEIPAGWSTDGCGFGKYPGVDGAPGPDEVMFSTWNVTHIFTDACDWDERTGVIPAGSTTAELNEAMKSQLGHEASATTDVEVDGFPALRTQFTMAPDVDPSTCTNGYNRVWMRPNLNFAGGWCCSPRNAILDLRFVDVNGQRVVVLTEYQPDSSPQDIAELEAMVDSIDFDAPAASQAP